jgi:hypothetical protein
MVHIICTCFVCVKEYGIVSVLALNSGKNFLEAIHFVVACWGWGHHQFLKSFWKGSGIRLLWRNVTRDGWGQFYTKIVWRHLWTTPCIGKGDDSKEMTKWIACQIRIISLNKSFVVPIYIRYRRVSISKNHPFLRNLSYKPHCSSAGCRDWHDAFLSNIFLP